MPTRLFKTYKFRYTQDDGTTIIRVQRVYLDTVSQTQLTPITQKFLDRTLTDSTRLPALLGRLRFLEAIVNNPNAAKKYSELTTFLPYKPGDDNLKQHIREVLEVSNVLCASYRGENRSYA